MERRRRQDADRSSLLRFDLDPMAGPSCCVKMWAPRGCWHLQASRLKGGNFTDNMDCCKNFHLANLALQDHKTSAPFNSVPAFVFLLPSLDFNLWSSPGSVLVILGHFYLFCFCCKVAHRHCVKHCDCGCFGISPPAQEQPESFPWSKTVVMLPSVCVHGSLSGIVFS